MLFHYGRTYAHGAIVVEAEPLTIVHAFFRARRVVEERLTVRSDLLQHQKRGSPGPMVFTHWPWPEARGSQKSEESERRETWRSSSGLWLPIF